MTISAMKCDASTLLLLKRATESSGASHGPCTDCIAKYIMNAFSGDAAAWCSIWRTASAENMRAEYLFWKGAPSSHC